jgi:hypothetical protein
MDQRRDNPAEIKALIANGQYAPCPQAVASAMLRRPGLRLFFGINGGGARVGQTQSV